MKEINTITIATTINQFMFIFCAKLELLTKLINR